MGADAEGVALVSPHLYNTAADVDRLLEELTPLV
jgi:selenocysteine lyase/cysteine desulfurase